MRSWSTNNIGSKEQILGTLNRAIKNKRFFTATIEWHSLFLDAYEYHPKKNYSGGPGFYHIFGRPKTITAQHLYKKMPEKNFRAALTKRWNEVLEIETE